MLLLTGCRGTNGPVIYPYDESTYSDMHSTSENTDTSKPASSNAYFSYGLSLLLLGKSEDGYDTPVNLLAPVEGEINLSARITASPDISLRLEQSDLDIYVFCDGVLIPHSIDGGELSEKSRVTVNNYNSSILSISIPEIKTESGGMKKVSVICRGMPDFMPQEGRQELQMTVASSFRAMTVKDGKADNSYVAAADDYIDGLLDKEGYEQYSYITDIGYSIERAEELGKDGNHYYTPVKIGGDTDRLTVTAQLSETYDCYACVFIDNELVNAFDGRQFMRFDSEDNKMLCCGIPRSVLPKAGEHSMELVILPSTQAIPYEQPAADVFASALITPRYRLTLE